VCKTAEPGNYCGKERTPGRKAIVPSRGEEEGKLSIAHSIFIYWRVKVFYILRKSNRKEKKRENDGARERRGARRGATVRSKKS